MNRSIPQHAPRPGRQQHAGPRQRPNVAPSVAVALCAARSTFRHRLVAGSVIFGLIALNLAVITHAAPTDPGGEGTLPGLRSMARHADVPMPPEAGGDDDADLADRDAADPMGQLRRAVDQAPQSPTHPLERIARTMDLAARPLARLDTGPRTQTPQEEVISDLDQLIEMLEDQQNSSQSGSGADAGGQATSPMQDSQIGAGGEMGELRDPRQGRRMIDDLPPRERERILQAGEEGFPPEYEAVLLEYYRRLAEAGDDETPADARP